MLHHIVFAKVGVPDYTCKTFTDFDGNKRAGVRAALLRGGRGADDDLDAVAATAIRTAPPTAGA